LLEKSLRYMGIDYTHLPAPTGKPWHHSIKISVVADYLASGACKTDLMMMVDCDDAMMLESPQLAIDLLDQSGAQMLVSSAREAKQEHLRLLVLTNPHRDWAKKIAEEAGYVGPFPFINSGIYIARREFLRRFLGEAVKYVTDHDFTTQGLRERLNETGVLPEGFPMACGDDQVIFRYLQPAFHPDIKVDYEQHLSLR
jgi:hypothetical protein